MIDAKIKILKSLIAGFGSSEDYPEFKIYVSEQDDVDLLNERLEKLKIFGDIKVKTKLNGWDFVRPL